MSSRSRIAALWFALCALAGCGGGGSDAAPASGSGNPASPTNPSGNGDPANPANPANPSNPSDPSNPSNPSNPSDPSTGNPGNPGTDPNDPGTSPDGPVTAFAITSVAPGNGATAVPRSDGYVATFTAAPAPASTTAQTVQLVGPESNTIPGTLSASGNDVRFTAAGAALPGGTTYSMYFSPDITDAAGRHLAASYASSFTTAVQNWGAQATVINGTQSFTAGAKPAVATDSAGNVTALWTDSASGITTINASRQDPATGAWSAPELVRATASGDVVTGPVRIVADASGNTYAFWNETISGVGTPMTARHVASASGWEPALPVGGLSSLSNPEIANAAIDGSGVITLLVLESGNANLYASRYDPVAGIWGTAQEIDAPLTIQPIAQTALVADAAGNVTASWIQDYGSSADISFASFRAGFGWGAPEILDVNVALLPIALAADRQGGATAAWTHGYQFVGLQYISASRWLPSTTSWTTATQISPNHTLSLVPPVVAVDGAGIATVLWQEPGGVSGVRSDAYGAAWSAPAAITGVSAGAVELALTADVAGNLMLTYLQNPTTVSAVRYSATSVAWEAPLAIGTLALGNTVLANGAVPVMDASGTVTLVWLASVDAGSPSSVVAANRFH